MLSNYYFRFKYGYLWMDSELNLRVSATEPSNLDVDGIPYFNGATGWAEYPDDYWTSGNPFQINVTPKVLEINGVGKRETQKPLYIDKFWEPAYILYDAETSAFTAGETLTGGTSGATAIIVSVVDDGTTGTLYLQNLNGTFQDNETITDSLTGSATANGANVHGKILGRNGDAMQITIEFIAKPTNAGTTYLEYNIDIAGAVGDLYTRITTFPKGNGVERIIATTTGVFTLDTWEANGGFIEISANNSCDIYEPRIVFINSHRAR